MYVIIDFSPNIAWTLQCNIYIYWKPWYIDLTVSESPLLALNIIDFGRQHIYSRQRLFNFIWIIFSPTKFAMLHTNVEWNPISHLTRACFDTADCATSATRKKEMKTETLNIRDKQTTQSIPDRQQVKTTSVYGPSYIYIYSPHRIGYHRRYKHLFCRQTRCRYIGNGPWLSIATVDIVHPSTILHVAKLRKRSFRERSWIKSVSVSSGWPW